MQEASFKTGSELKTLCGDNEPLVYQRGPDLTFTEMISAVEHPQPPRFSLLSLPQISFYFLISHIR